MKRHLTILILALSATAQTPSPMAKAEHVKAPAGEVKTISPDLSSAYYKQWGEYQSMIARFQQTLTSQQKAIQEEIKAREDAVNRLAQALVTACGGNLDVKSLNEQNTIKCLPAPTETAAQKPKE